VYANGARVVVSTTVRFFKNILFSPNVSKGCVEVVVVGGEVEAAVDVAEVVAVVLYNMCSIYYNNMYYVYIENITIFGLQAHVCCQSK